MFKKRRFSRRPWLPYHKRRRINIVIKQLLLPLTLLQFLRTILLPTAFDIILLVIFITLFIIVSIK